MFGKSALKLTTCLAGAAMLIGAASAQAETLRLLTWGSYAPDDVIKLFEEKYPDIPGPLNWMVSQSVTFTGHCCA